MAALLTHLVVGRADAATRMCLARGRSYTVPVTPILKRCDQWHISNIADTMDGHLVSMAVLRRDLVRLFPQNLRRLPLT